VDRKLAAQRVRAAFEMLNTCSGPISDSPKFAFIMAELKAIGHWLESPPIPQLEKVSTEHT